MRFVIGVLVGLVLGMAGTAVAATCLGSGYAFGWTIVVDGVDVCDDPFIWSGTREIECD